MSGDVRDDKEMSAIPIEGNTIEIQAKPWLKVMIDGQEIYVGSVKMEWDGRTGESPRPRIELGITPRNLKFIKEGVDGEPLATLNVDNSPAICSPLPSGDPDEDNLIFYRNEFGVELPKYFLRVKSNENQFAELVARTQIEHGLAIIIDPDGPGERFASLVRERLGGRVRKMIEEVFVENFNPEHLAEYLAGRYARIAYMREHEGRFPRLGSDTTFVRYSQDEPVFEIPGGLPPIYAKASRLVMTEDGSMFLEGKSYLWDDVKRVPLAEADAAMESEFQDSDQDTEEVSKSQDQINTLASFILKEVPGEPSRDEGAVECAIRLLKGGLTAAKTSEGGNGEDTGKDKG